MVNIFLIWRACQIDKLIDKLTSQVNRSKIIYNNEGDNKYLMKIRYFENKIKQNQHNLQLLLSRMTDKENCLFALRAGYIDKEELLKIELIHAQG